MTDRSNRVLNYDGLGHLVDRLDARYWDALAQSLTDEEVETLLSGIDISEPEGSSSISIPEGALLNNAGPKKDRVLNYPGLTYLIGRLDQRYLRDGNGVYSARKLTNARTISITGEASGEGVFDGSTDVDIYTSVKRISNTELEEMLT